MDLRAPAGSAVSNAFLRWNHRHPWSHNDHFHGWILANLPQRRERALDVGCGQGELAARLASRFCTVVADDVDPAMRAATQRRCAGLPNVSVTGDQLDDLAGPFDLVTMVAVLHHLDAASALRQVRRLVAPGGRFLCVGLARVAGPADLAWDVASIVTNPVIGWVEHPWPNREPMRPDPFPTKDPELSLGELRAVLDAELPGAAVRRQLGFRHTIAWQQPG